MAETKYQSDMSVFGENAPFPLTVALSEEERLRTHAAKRQEAIVALGRRAVAPPTLPILLHDAAALLAEMFDAEYSGVAEALPDGKTLRRQLMRRDDSDEPTPCDAEATTLDGNASLGAYALELAHPVVVANLVEETRFTDLFLRRHGIASAVAIPLRLRGEAFGALGAYSVRPGHFGKDDVLFMESIGHLIATTIGRCRAEDELARERKLSEGVLGVVDALVLILDRQWRIVHVNRACQSITGFAAAEIEGRPIWDVFVVQEANGWVRTLMDRCHESRKPVEYESVLQTKHSARRRIAWRYQTVLDSEGAVSSIVATGIDITERCDLQKRLDVKEREAMAAKKELAEWKETQRQASEALAEMPEIVPFSAMPTPLNAERRQRPRRSYPYAQRIAPIIKGELPKEQDFEAVECNDIAAGGFSFFATHPPVSDAIVVALGTPPKVTYLTAQVAHITRQTRNGRRMYLIGCSYTGRIHY